MLLATILATDTLLTEGIYLRGIGCDFQEVMTKDEGTCELVDIHR